MSEADVDMAVRKTARYLRNIPYQPGMHFTLLILLGIACGRCFYLLVGCLYSKRYDNYVTV